MLSKLLAMLGAFAAIAPLLTFAIGVVLESIIPECTVDEGAGGQNCSAIGLDFSDSIAFMLLGGFVSILLGVPLAIALFMLSAVVGYFERRKPG
jgi:hypothetical protein